MSKKLIAIAAAAALALTGLVATPANATSITGVVIDAESSVSASHASNTSADTPGTAMTSRTLDYNSSASTTRNVVRYVVTTASATTVSVTSAGGVKVIKDLADADGVAYKLDTTVATTGVSGSTTDTALTFTFYAFTTSTTAGSVVISTPSSSLTYYVKGLAGAAYNLTNVKFPTSIIQGQAAADSTAVVSYVLTDVFGNAKTDGTAPVLTALGATASTSTYSTLRLVWEAVVYNATSSSVAMALNLSTADLSTNGFAKPVIYAFSSVSAADLATQVTTLTAQVATLQASVVAMQAILDVSRLDENSVTQKKYNTLARKWNAAFPSQAVALKK
jgi:hypothetical protein